MAITPKIEVKEGITNIGKLYVWTWKKDFTNRTSGQKGTIFVEGRLWKDDNGNTHSANMDIGTTWHEKGKKSLTTVAFLTWWTEEQEQKQARAAIKKCAKWIQSNT